MKPKKEQNEDKAELFRQAVLKSKRERAARAERILDLVAQFCGADKCDYDGIENAVSGEELRAVQKKRYGVQAGAVAKGMRGGKADVSSV